MNFKNVFSWTLRLIVAIIFLQTLFYKFTGSVESVYIFSTLGIEPIGRIGTGILELIATILILLNRTVIFGAFIALGTMLGAIFSHLFTSLGITIMNDGGLLFSLAIIVAVCSLGLLYIHKSKIFELKNRLLNKNIN